MKKANLFAIAMFAGLLTFSSCASKKDLENCRLENKELTSNYQNTKEELAASKARLASLEDQLEQQKKDYAALQSSLDKSLTNAGDNNVNISKLVDQINESNQYIRHLVEVKSKSDSLNMVLTNKPESGKDGAVLLHSQQPRSHQRGDEKDQRAAWREVVSLYPI